MLMLSYSWITVTPWGLTTPWEQDSTNTHESPELTKSKRDAETCLKARADWLIKPVDFIRLASDSDSLVHVCLFSFHVDVLRATTGFLAEVTARRRWRLAVSFRISTGLQTESNGAGWTFVNFCKAVSLRTPRTVKSRWSGAWQRAAPKVFWGIFVLGSRWSPCRASGSLVATS